MKDSIEKAGCGSPNDATSIAATDELYRLSSDRRLKSKHGGCDYCNLNQNLK